MTPVDTDIGLWVMGAGKLDLTGTAKSGWLRATVPIKTGDTDVTLESAPIGWQAGDEIVIVPTAYGKTDPSDFETRKIIDVVGTKVSFDTGASADHPVVSLPNGKKLGAEVINLTRNVRIEGNPPQYLDPPAGQINTDGRTHIFIHNDVPTVQTVQYVAIRYTGPRKYDPVKQETDFVTGRYGLHFHISGDNNAGTLVQGVVVRDSGSHAFVPHTSNNVTFRDDVTFNTFETAYWWDQTSMEPGIGPFTRSCVDHPMTNNTLFDHVIAAIIQAHTTTVNYRLAAFELLRGTGNTNKNSVAVGVQGGKDSSGFFWPSPMPAPSVWTFEGNIAHNNKNNGIFVWQNDNENHVISDFTAYHNGRSGILQGAYKNSYLYKDSTFYRNNSNQRNPDGAEIEERVSGGDRGGVEKTFVIDNVNIDGGGSSKWALRIDNHLVGNGSIPVRFSNWNVTGLTGSAINIDDAGKNPDNPSGKHAPSVVDFVCWKINGHSLDLADFSISSIDSNDVLRLQQANNVAFQLKVQNNQLVKAPINSFASCGK